MEKIWEKMGFILLFLLFLASFQFSDGIKCTTDNTFPCRCTLSDGPVGFVDISPLFYDGPLTAVDSKCVDFDRNGNQLTLSPRYMSIV